MTTLARFEEVAVRYGSHAVALRPTLRAAMTLERLHGGWPGLLSSLSQFNLSTVQALIRASAVCGLSAEALLHSFKNRPLAEIKAATAAPLAALLAMFFASGDDTPAQPQTKPKPWLEAYAELYRIGTGWLGWSAAETWAATPTEITQAFEGHVAMLKAIHGSGDDADTGPSEAQRKANIAAGLDPDFDRAGLHALKGC